MLTHPKRNLTETHKKAIAKRALELKEKYPYLSWAIIVKRLNGVKTIKHLKEIIEKYGKKNRNG